MELADFLLTVGKVPEKQIKYYLIWISRYNTYKKQHPQNDEQDYFGYLSVKCQDWQLQRKSRPGCMAEQ